MATLRSVGSSPSSRTKRGGFEFSFCVRAEIFCSTDFLSSKISLLPVSLERIWAQLVGVWLIGVFSVAPTGCAFTDTNKMKSALRRALKKKLIIVLFILSSV